MIRLIDQVRRTVRDYDAEFGAGQTLADAIDLLKFALFGFWGAVAIFLTFQPGAAS